MVLSDSTIKDLGEQLVSPFVEENVSASSIDLTLGDAIVIENGQKLSIKDDFGGMYVVNPDEFLLMTTAETVHIPDDILAIVKGKSSRAREGLAIEFANLIDPGFFGPITLEVKNMNQERSIILEPGMKIAQMYFMKLDRPAERPYSADHHHYQDQKGTTRAWDAESEKNSPKKQRIVGVLGLNRNDDAVMVRYTYLKPFYYPNDSNGTMVNTSDYAENERFVRFLYEYDIDLSGKPCPRLKNYIAFFNQMLDGGYIQILNPEVLEWEGE